MAMLATQPHICTSTRKRKEALDVANKAAQLVSSISLARAEGCKVFGPFFFFYFDAL